MGQNSIIVSDVDNGVTATCGECQRTEHKLHGVNGWIDFESWYKIQTFTEIHMRCPCGNHSVNRSSVPVY